MFTFATDYYILVFIATVGVIQIAASTGPLTGLLIFKSPLVSRVIGAALVAAGFVLFFSTAERNINDYEGGLDAPTQALFFFLGTMSGGLVTFLVSSVTNLRMNQGEPSPESGLDALEHTNFVRAVLISLGYWLKNWRTQTKRYFSG